MSAARVVNPFSLSEVRRLREAVRLPMQAQAQALLPHQHQPSAEARARVCRNLYGGSSEAARSFVQRELAQQVERASERWGFDFLRGVPRDTANSRFLWCPVTPGSAPKAYSRMAGTGTSTSTREHVDRTPSPAPPAPAPAPAPTQRQAQITEFMKCRKRPIPSSKEGGSTQPAKRKKLC